MDNDQSIDLAVECTRYARSITKDDPKQAGTQWLFEFSPETFSDSDPAFVVDICEAVKHVWEPTVEKKIIFNLPATVEMSTPNVYADQIEYFCTNITDRWKICVSLHPHNDRGCAVAAAELAQIAGADRVEGTLFGNGERTGNVDLVCLALNLYTQGIHPGVDFSDIKSVIALVEKSNKIPVHERTPYGGELVVSAFSGSHQDAIKKGFAVRKANNATSQSPWQIPYLPLDPQDIGRDYEAVIRVNSQSGKGGVAWVIERTMGLDMPRGLQIAFSKVVQAQADRFQRELTNTEIRELFERTYYLNCEPRMVVIEYDITLDRPRSPGYKPKPTLPGRKPASDTLMRVFNGLVKIDKFEKRIMGNGNGPVSALTAALAQFKIYISVTEYREHSIGEGSNVKAVAYIEVKDTSKTQLGNSKTQQDKYWGVGINSDVTQASLQAVLSAASNVRRLHVNLVYGNIYIF